MNHTEGSLNQRQQQMMDALLGKSDRIAEHIVGDENLNSEQRLSIYKTGYKLRLREVIDNDHPVLGSYLGDELFEQMVEGYIGARPSQFRSLRYYCDPLPEYLRSDSFFSQYPHIAELARFERYLLSSFDAPDSETVTQSSLQQLPAEQWPQLQLRFHPSLQLFTSEYNVVEIWQSIKAERIPPDPEQQPVSWAVWRNRERLTEFSSVDRLEYQLLCLFLQGENFSAAAEITAIQVGEEHAAENLLMMLLGWLERGWVSQLTDAATHPVLEPV